jgi:hypothetical protein
MRPMLYAMALVTLCACQTPMQTGNQCVVAPGFLSGESTFTWRSQGAIDVDDKTGYVSPLMQKGLAQAVVAEMGRKGFDLVEPTAGDSAASGALAGVELALTLRTRRELVSMTVNESPCIDTDCWERVDMGSSTRMDMRTIGFLAADVYYNGEPIWRGWVERNLYPKDRDEAQAVISEAVPALLESFPP